MAEHEAELHASAPAVIDLKVAVAAAEAAADRINAAASRSMAEMLARITELEAALKPFAEEFFDASLPDDAETEIALTIGNLRRASEAYASRGPTPADAPEASK